MSRPSRKPHAVGVAGPTAIHGVRFGKEAHPGDHHDEEKPSLRVPRVARLLALAHRIDGMIRSGELKDWAEAAHLIGVTRARMTQIANMMLLAPEIQERILTWIAISKGHDPVTEHGLRPVALQAVWKKQLRRAIGRGLARVREQQQRVTLRPN